MKKIPFSIVGCVILELAGAARADPMDDRDTEVRARLDQSAPVAAVLPLGDAAAVERGGGFLVAMGGYDTGARRTRGETTMEVGLTSWLALHTGVSATDQWTRPSVGVRVQLLREGRDGVDASALVQYKLEGFSEPEGEVEAMTTARKTFGAVAVLGSAAYGQDPEGHERDGEARVGGIVHLGRRIEAGVDGRVRANLGAIQPAEPRYDLAAGPVVAAAIGRFFVTGQLGLAGVAMGDRPLVLGLGATAGIGATF